MFTIKAPRGNARRSKHNAGLNSQDDLLRLMRMHIHSRAPAQMKLSPKNKAAANTVICSSAVRHSRVLPSSTLLITIIRKKKKKKKPRLHAATNSFHSGHFSARLIFKTQHKHSDGTLEERHRHPHRLCCLHPTRSH